IGGSVNQTAMFEIYKFNPQKYGGILLIDIVIANIWMTILLFGISKQSFIDKFLKADTSSIEKVKKSISSYTQSIARMPNLNDFIILLGVTFGGVALSQIIGKTVPTLISNSFGHAFTKSDYLSTFNDSFFWMVTAATIIGISLSKTKFK